MADKDWYQEHQKLFEDLYGRDKLNLVTQLFAATSINSSLESNVRLFRKALNEIENGKPFSNYLPVMRLQLDRIRAGEPIQGRKISSFAAAMSGDVNAVVVDIWLLRAFEINQRYPRVQEKYDSRSGTLYSRKIRMREGGATDRQYDYIEKFVRDLAPSYGLLPYQLSAVIWSGVRIFHTGNKRTKYKDVLLSQEYNMFNL